MAEAIKSADKARIKHLMKSDEWDSVTRFFKSKIDGWNEATITGQNEFETLKTLHTQQGKVEGLTEFMEQMERQAFE